MLWWTGVTVLLGGDVTAPWLTELNEIPALEAAVTYFDVLLNALDVNGIAMEVTVEVLSELTTAFALHTTGAGEVASLPESTVELAHELLVDDCWWNIGPLELASPETIRPGSMRSPSARHFSWIFTSSWATSCRTSSRLRAKERFYILKWPVMRNGGQRQI